MRTFASCSVGVHRGAAVVAAARVESPHVARRCAVRGFFARRSFVSWRVRGAAIDEMPAGRKNVARCRCARVMALSRCSAVVREDAARSRQARTSMAPSAVAVSMWTPRTSGRRMRYSVVRAMPAATAMSVYVMPASSSARSRRGPGRHRAGAVPGGGPARAAAESPTTSPARSGDVQLDRRGRRHSGRTRTGRVGHRNPSRGTERSNAAAPRTGGRAATLYTRGSTSVRSGPPSTSGTESG